MMLPRRHSMRPSHFLAILMAVTVPAYLLSITFLFQPGSHHAAGPAVGESIASPVRVAVAQPPLLLGHFLHPTSLTHSLPIVNVQAQDSASVQVVRINSTGDTPVAAPPGTKPTPNTATSYLIVHNHMQPTTHTCTTCCSAGPCGACGSSEETNEVCSALYTLANHLHTGAGGCQAPCVQPCLQHGELATGQCPPPLGIFLEI